MRETGLGNMRIEVERFKHYLLVLAVTFAGVMGCKSTEEGKPKKDRSLVMLHIETNPDGTKYTRKIAVYKSDPIFFHIYTEPFLDTGSLDQATVMDALGGFAIQLQFNRHGTAVLDSFTTSNKGRHLIIFCQFDEPRWLAAPIISRRNSTGIIRFTPDCTREEADRIVRGLNNSVKDIRKKN